MAELIDRKQIFFAEKPESFVKGNEDYREGFFDGAMCVLNAVDTMPTIEAKPIVRAHWKRKNNEMKCSNCEFIYYSNHDDFSFCPNCGAQMDEFAGGNNVGGKTENDEKEDNDGQAGRGDRTLQ